MGLGLRFGGVGVVEFNEHDVFKYLNSMVGLFLNLWEVVL